MIMKSGEFPATVLESIDVHNALADRNRRVRNAAMSPKDAL